MFKSDSIIIKITLLFTFSSVSFVLFVLYFISAEASKNNIVIEQRYNGVVDSINDLLKFGYGIDDLHDYLLDIGFHRVTDDNIVDKAARRFIHYRDNSVTFNAKKIDGHYYIIIEDMDEQSHMVYTDYSYDADYSTYYLIASLSFITLIFFYILVLKSLLPLRVLRNEVQKFSSGDMDIKVISNNRDEIGELSREFAKAASTINEMNKARSLFLRSIMHELKTPITKGRIVTEMLSDAKSKDRLISVFTRLNVIIEDFAKVEEINTNNHKIERTQFSLKDLFFNVNKMLFIEDERPRSVILMNRSAKMMADFDLMSLSIKNLIDNAIKYSIDHKVIIFVSGNDLVIQNQGNPFKNDISSYFAPFYSDGSINPQKGLGLGMYIIKNTIEVQGFSLEYEYLYGSHYFYIKNCIINNT